MRTGRPTAPLILTMTERETLQQWTRRPKTAQALAQQARMILACAAGQTNTAVARDVRVAQQTVCKWRQRFVTHRLDGLLDEPRPGAPRRVTDVEVERIVTQTLETTPTHATHWSTRAMAQRSGVSRSTVHRIWRAFGLQPHRSETFAVGRSAVCREGARYCGALSLSSGQSAGLVRR